MPQQKSTLYLTMGPGKRKTSKPKKKKKNQTFVSSEFQKEKNLGLKSTWVNECKLLSNMPRQINMQI